MKFIWTFLLLFLLKVTATTAQWTHLDGPWGGAIDVVAGDSATQFAGSKSGLYKSSDHGHTWTKKLLRASSCIAKNGDIVFSGTECSTSHSCGFEGNLVCSVDNGETWTDVDSTLPSNLISSLAFFHSSILAAVYNEGIYMSNDTGRTWTPMGFSGANIISITTKGNNIFVGTDIDGIYFSRDTGNTWSRYGTDYPYFGLVDLAAAYQMIFVDSVLFATTIDGVFACNDSLSIWNYRSPGLPSGYYNTSTITSISTSLFVGMNYNVYSSSDYGLNWTISGTGIPDRHTQSLENVGGYLLAGNNYDGVYRSSDNGLTWEHSNTGISDCTISKIELSNNQLFVLSNTELYRSDNSGTDWWKLSNYDIQKGANDFIIEDSTIYLGCNAYPFTAMYKSTDLGNTWNSLGLDSVISISIYKYGNKLFNGTIRLLASDDDGISWHPQDSGMSNSAYISSMVSLGNYLFATNGGDFYTSSDSGFSWNSVYTNAQTPPYHTNNSSGVLKVNNGDIIFESGGAFNFSSDTGKIWVTKIPNASIADFVVVQNKIIATEGFYGILFSNDYGDTWTSYNDGILNYLPDIPFPYIAKLGIDSMYVYATPYSFSLFRRPLIDFGITSQISNLPDQNTFSIAPNPARTDFTFNCKEEITNMIIYNLLGDIVCTNLFHDKSSKVSIQNIKPGIYFIRASNNNTTYTQKLIIN